MGSTSLRMALLLLAGAVLLLVGCKPPAPRELANARKRVEQQPHTAHAWNALGRAYMSEKMYNDAYIAFKRALALDDRDYDARYGLAEACYFLADPQSGLGWIKLALERKPNEPAAIGLRGRLYLASGDVKRAVVDLEKAANLDPSLVDVRLALINAYRFQNRLDAALSQAEKLMQFFPGDARVHWVYGALLDQKGRLSEAEAQFRAAVEHDPSMTKAKYSLASVLVRSGKKLQEAERLAREVAEEGLGDGLPEGLAARALFLQGRRDQALRDLARACDQHPRNLQLLVWLYEMAKEMGQKEVADRTEAIIRQRLAGAAGQPAPPPPE